LKPILAAEGTTGLVFLDNNSTTRVLPEVIEAMVEALESGAGNASSAHGSGILARQMLADAREQVSRLCGTVSDQITFTSGATEANNVVLQLPLTSRGASINRVVTSTIEHSSVLGPCAALEEHGIEVVWLRPTPNGQVSVEDVARAGLGANTLVSLHWVNNETGVIQPVEEVASLCRSAGALFHVDAAQALGRLPVHFHLAGFDYMTGSAHKLHGPQGVGVLAVREGTPLAPLAHGGGQEGGIRPGTENLPGVAGFGAAARIALDGLSRNTSHVRAMRDALESGAIARVPGALVNGGGVERAAGTTNLRFPGMDGEAVVALMNQRGVYISQSSACTNMRPEPSYVLREMGLDEDEAYESVRMCASRDTGLDDVRKALEALSEVVGILGNEVHVPKDGQVKEAAAG